MYFRVLFKLGSIMDQALHLVVTSLQSLNLQETVLLLFLLGLISHSPLSPNKTHQKSKEASLGKGAHLFCGMISSLARLPETRCFISEGKEGAGGKV